MRTARKRSATEIQLTRIPEAYEDSVDISRLSNQDRDPEQKKRDEGIFQYPASGRRMYCEEQDETRNKPDKSASGGGQNDCNTLVADKKKKKKPFRKPLRNHEHAHCYKNTRHQKAA